MPANKRQRREKAATQGLIFMRVVRATIVFWIVAIALIISPHGKETFRAPKDFVYLAVAIVLAGCLVAAALFFRVADLGLFVRQPLTVIGAAALVWTAVTTLTSTNRALSVPALIWLAATLAIALALALLAPDSKLTVLRFALAGAAVNAVIFLLQRFHVWTPMQFDAATPDHLKYTALIGNPDDIGSFLVAPLLTALALAIVDKRLRVLWIGIVVLLSTALLTGQITSIVAVAAGAIAMAFFVSRRTGVISFVAVVLMITLVVVGYPPMRSRFDDIRVQLASGDYASAFSGRVTPFASALLMARDHPIFGVGPDCFAWQYYPYKVDVERRRPILLNAYAHSFNFGEVHNDHLQTLAETGALGYLLLLAAVGSLARRSFSGRRERPEGEFARLICAPLAVALFVLCLAHFPLHLASATSMFLFIGVLAYVWAAPREMILIPRETKALGAQTARLIAIAAVGIGCAALIYDQSYAPYVCNQRKRDIETATMRTLTLSDPTVASLRARKALGIIDDCLEKSPTDVDFYMLAAANDRIIGGPADAEAMYTKALRFDRRPELYFNLASAQLEQHHRADSVRNYVAAVVFNRDVLSDVPPEVHDEVLSIVARDYPYLGFSRR